jgi:hypothetical protein
MALVLTVAARRFRLTTNVSHGRHRPTNVSHGRHRPTNVSHGRHRPTVRTLEGLFLLKPIPRDIDFDPKPEYLRMMENLRTSILALPEDVNGLRAEFYNLPTTV